MGGDARYPFPKYVWSPSGGWWSRPHNWRTNTAVAVAGSLAIVYAVFSISAEKEYRPIAPHENIPSMKWAKQYRAKSDEPAL